MTEYINFEFLSTEKLRNIHLLVGYDDMIDTEIKSVIKLSNCHGYKFDISLECTRILAEAAM